MENKLYNYNGKIFTLKPLTLSLMKSVMPMIAKLRKLQYDYTKDIDMRDVNIRKQRLTELETARKQLLGQKEVDGITDDERAEITTRINVLNDKIMTLKKELEEDDSLQQKIKLYNECSAIALYELISNAEIIKPVIEAIIHCKDHPGELPAIDFLNPESIKFLSQVITDFFLLIPKIKGRLPV